MATYAIGDIQGCFVQLQQLLAHIKFNPDSDTLWFTGDLVNRGPQSLEVLRFVKSLGDKHKIVLGNHDLHLLAVAHGVGDVRKGDTLNAILTAKDRDELINWLRFLPLLHADKQTDYVMVHAGLAPAWRLSEAKILAQEVETVLRGDTLNFFLENMYGDEPNQWNDQLSGIERLRCITNYFTRMRFCDADGRLDLSYKGTINDKPKNLLPWFAVPHRANKNVKIIFGHWAALDGVTNTAHVYALDTGCVWGNCLTAMRLEDEKRFTVPC